MKKLNKTEKHLLLIIRKIQGKNDFCRLKNSWLASQLNCTERTVQRTKKKLLEVGLIYQKEILGRTPIISTLPINSTSANIVKLKMSGVTKLKRGQFTFQANGNPIYLEDSKTEADKISLVLHLENSHPLEKNVTPQSSKMSPPIRQSFIDNLYSNPNGLEEPIKSDSTQELFPIAKKPKRKKTIKPDSDLVKVEKYLFNFWKFIGKEYYYNYPKERKQIQRLLKIATVNEICNRFVQMYALISSDEFYKKRNLVPTGLTYHVLNTLQTINNDSKKTIQGDVFIPRNRKENRKKYSFYLEFSAWKKGFKSYVHELRARKLQERKVYSVEEIRF